MDLDNGLVNLLPIFICLKAHKVLYVFKVKLKVKVITNLFGHICSRFVIKIVLARLIVCLQLHQ